MVQQKGSVNQCQLYDMLGIQGLDLDMSFFETQLTMLLQTVQQTHSLQGSENNWQ